MLRSVAPLNWLRQVATLNSNFGETPKMDETEFPWTGWERRLSDAITHVTEIEGTLTQDSIATKAKIILSRIYNESTGPIPVKETSISPKSVEKWKSLDRRPSYEKLFAACLAMGVDPSEILFGKPILTANKLAIRIAKLNEVGRDMVEATIEIAEKKYPATTPPTSTITQTEKRKR